MLDIMNISPWNIVPEGRKQNPYLFDMPCKPGLPVRDIASGVDLSANIPGSRYRLNPDTNLIESVAPNVPAIEANGLRACPAYPQLATYTEDLTNAAWAKTNITATLANILQGQKTHYLKETATNTYHQLSFGTSGFTSLTDNSVIGVCFVARPAGRNIIQIRFWNKPGVLSRAYFDLTTGVVSNVDSGLRTGCYPLADGYYQCFVAGNIGAGTALPEILFRLFNGQEVYAGDITKGIEIGHVTRINFGVNGIPFIPPYIPNNTGSAVAVVSETATATTGMSLDLDNTKLSLINKALKGPGAQGHIEFVFNNNIIRSLLPHDNRQYNILSCGTLPASLFYFQDSDTTLQAKMYDGTLAPSLNLPDFKKGDTLKISLDYGTHSTGQKMRLTINGTSTPLTPFAGTWGTEDLVFFKSSLIHSGWIKNLKFLPRPLW